MEDTTHEEANDYFFAIAEAAQMAASPVRFPQPSAPQQDSPPSSPERMSDSPRSTSYISSGSSSDEDLQPGGSPVLFSRVAAISKPKEAQLPPPPSYAESQAVALGFDVPKLLEAIALINSVPTVLRKQGYLLGLDTKPDVAFAIMDGVKAYVENEANKVLLDIRVETKLARMLTLKPYFERLKSVIAASSPQKHIAFAY